MSNDLTLIYFIFSPIIGFLISYFSIPFIIKIGNKYNLIDKPDIRKRHKKPTVNIGGISFFLSILPIVIWFLFINYDSQFILVIAISFIAFLIGLLDDIFKISYIYRLILLIILSSIFWYKGIRVENIFFNIGLLKDEVFSIPVTLSFIFNTIWFGGVTNAINWMDGIDGLACGASIIILFTFLPFLEISESYQLTYFCLALIGSSIAFLIYNKYPAKIFMGDGGSYFLGYIIASLSILSSTRVIFIDNLEFGSTLTNILFPLSVLFVPILDMVCVILKRISNKKSPFFPDRSHLHHLLQEKNISISNTVLIILMLVSICSLISFIFVDFKFKILYYFLFMVVLFLIYFYKKSN